MNFPTYKVWACESSHVDPAWRVVVRDASQQILSELCAGELAVSADNQRLLGLESCSHVRMLEALAVEPSMADAIKTAAVRVARVYAEANGLEVFSEPVDWLPQTVEPGKVRGVFAFDAMRPDGSAARFWIEYQTAKSSDFAVEVFPNAGTSLREVVPIAGARHRAAAAQAARNLNDQGTLVSNAVALKVGVGLPEGAIARLKHHGVIKP